MIRHEWFDALQRVRGSSSHSYSIYRFAALAQLLLFEFRNRRRNPKEHGYALSYPVFEQPTICQSGDLTCQ
jgi:hypothetical protein